MPAARAEAALLTLPASVVKMGVDSSQSLCPAAGRQVHRCHLPRFLSGAGDWRDSSRWLPKSPSPEAGLAGLIHPRSLQLHTCEQGASCVQTGSKISQYKEGPRPHCHAACASTRSGRPSPAGCAARDARSHEASAFRTRKASADGGTAETDVVSHACR